MKNFYFFTQSENDNNIVNLVYNDNVIYSTSWWINTDITFYKNTLYFQKSDGCYYDSFDKTDNDFCWKWDYQIKVSNYGNNIVLVSNDKKLLKMNWKNYNTKGSGKMDFLWFSSDSKKAWFRVQWLENEKIMKIAIN